LLYVTTLQGSTILKEKIIRMLFISDDLGRQGKCTHGDIDLIMVASSSL